MNRKARRGEARAWIEKYIASLERGEFTDECVMWPFNHKRTGYGLVHIDQNRQTLVTRYVFERFSGLKLAGQEEQIRHSCDNPPCINLVHLATGSAADNSRDMVERGRSIRGERHNRARITEQDVRVIRNLLAKGHGSHSVAREFGLGLTQVHYIRTRERWGHI